MKLTDPVAFTLPRLRDAWLLLPLLPGIGVLAIAYLGPPGHPLVKWCQSWWWASLLACAALVGALKEMPAVKRWRARPS
jgi:hypothetical protein